MKITERTPVPRKEYGKILFKNHNLEQHEISTVFCLASFGFDIELLPPTDIPNSNNPDLLLHGTFWEMKRPKKFNKSTLKYRFQKAKRQSRGKAIFDLRSLHEKEINSAADYIIELFRTTRGMNHIMIILGDNKLLDITK